MVAPFSVYPKGTVPIRMLPIARILKMHGNQVLILVPPYDNITQSGRHYEIDGVRIINVKFTNLPIVKYPLTILRMLFYLIKVNANVIYVFKPKGYSGIIAMTIGVLKKVNVFSKTKLLLDTDDWEGLGGFADFFKTKKTYPSYMLKFFDIQERWTPKQVSAITTASRALESKLKEEGVNSSKIFYLPNGKPDRDFNVPINDVLNLRKHLGLEGVPVILLYTRFFEYKVEQIVEILSLVKQKKPNVKLLILGKGEFGEEKVLARLLQEKCLENSVVFGGWVKFDEIPKYLAVSDVAIYPFDDTIINRAKCPGKLIELMTAGRAIVANRVGQIKEYIQDGQSGLLAKSGDNAEFASLVTLALSDENLKRKLERNSKERINTTFDWCLLIKTVELAISKEDNN